MNAAEAHNVIIALRALWDECDLRNDDQRLSATEQGATWDLMKAAGAALNMTPGAVYREVSRGPRL